jgi:hypothetical protein
MSDEELSEWKVGVEVTVQAIRKEWDATIQYFRAELDDAASIYELRRLKKLVRKFIDKLRELAGSVRNLAEHVQKSNELGQKISAFLDRQKDDDGDWWKEGGQPPN